MVQDYPTNAQLETISYSWQLSAPIGPGQGLDDGTVTPTIGISSTGLDQSGQFTLHGSQIFNAPVYAFELVFRNRPRFFTIPVIQGQEVRYLVEGKSQVLGAFDELDAMDDGSRVATVTLRWLVRFVDKSDPLIVTNGLDVDTRRLGQDANGHTFSRKMVGRFHFRCSFPRAARA